MESNYKLTNSIVNHISNISASNAILENLPLPAKLQEELHQVAIIKSTHYSTKIEGNLITLEKVQTLLKGEEIVARPRDILEVTNYKKALDFIYDTDEDISLNMILKIHKILTTNIYEGTLCGHLRVAQNAIYNKDGGIVFIPPKAEDVETLMMELIEWYLAEKYLHPLIKVAMFHYEFVTIHPFLDGNGRSARILCEYLLKQAHYDTKKLISLDSYYENNLSEYYEGLDNGEDYYEDRVGANITNWITFYLRSMDIVTDIIKEATLNKYRLEKSSQQSSQESSQQILNLIKLNKYITAKELALVVKLTPRAIQKNIKKLKEQGIIKRVGANKGGYWEIQDESK